MTKLDQYMQDGACAQARAVLAMVQSFHIEGTWNSDSRDYDVDLKVSRWENGREQGYTVSAYIFKGGKSRGINIAFYEHRNSDSIHAVVFEKVCWRTPSLDDIPEDHPYQKGKYNTDFSVDYGNIVGMVDYIQDVLTNWWVSLEDKSE